MTHFPDQRWIATFNPDVGQLVASFRGDESFRERFDAKVDRRTVPGDDCHIWTAALSDEGYGNFTVGKRTVRAHRVAHILRFGNVTPWLYLDHVWPTCKYRFCVNTDHLEPVDHAENVRRGVGIGRANQRAMRYEALRSRDQWDLLRAA